MFDYCYDPELDLWVIMEDGYAVEWFVFKWQAVRHVKMLNAAIAE